MAHYSPHDGPLDPLEPKSCAGNTNRVREPPRQGREGMRFSDGGAYIKQAVEAAGDATPRAVPGFLPTPVGRRRSRSRRSAAWADLRTPRAARGSAPVLQHRRCQRRRCLQDGVLLLPPPPPLPRVTSCFLLELVWLIRGRHWHVAFPWVGLRILCCAV
jgi:hypothetical protein